MKISIPFTKASGAGNDFVLVNNMTGEYGTDFSRLAVAVCDRHFGVGADGLLVLEKSTSADFAMKYYNADGSYGGMCGNGGRCIAKFAFLNGIGGRKQRFEALGYTYEAEVGETSVTLRMKDPGDLRSDLALAVSGRHMEGTFINTGSPHVVILAPDLEELDVMKLGRAIRHDPMFRPDGTNVNFVRRETGSTIELRTYERGVESETLACGTGAVASALVASRLHKLSSPVTVGVRSGEQLLVHFSERGGLWTDVILEGSAHILFEGRMIYHTDESILRSTP